MASHSVAVPRVIKSERSEESWIVDGTKEYKLIEFPFDAYRLLGGKDQLDKSEAEFYASWLNEEERDRRRYAIEFLRAAGVSVSGPPGSAEQLPR